MRQLAWGLMAIVILWGTANSDLSAGKWKKSGCAGCATPYPSCSSPYPSCATPYHCAKPKHFKRGCAVPYGCSGGWGCSAPLNCATSCVGSCAGVSGMPMSATGEWFYDGAVDANPQWSTSSPTPLMSQYHQPLPAMMAPIPGVPVAEDVAW
ncbi:hypothetical protein GC163_14160 [bacterium]|nr:hypothetical protein [bacterium]